MVLEPDAQAVQGDVVVVADGRKAEGVGALARYVLERQRGRELVHGGVRPILMTQAVHGPHGDADGGGPAGHIDLLEPYLGLQLIARGGDADSRAGLEVDEVRTARTGPLAVRGGVDIAAPSTHLDHVIGTYPVHPVTGVRRPVGIQEHLHRVGAW